MKYTIVYLCLIAFPLFFIGCSDDTIKKEKEEDEKIVGRLSPPEWICYYEWENDNVKMRVSTKNLYIFSKPGGEWTGVDWIDFQDIIEKSSYDTKFEFFETIKTDDEYEAGMRMSLYNGTEKEYVYKFVKITELQIEYVISATEKQILNRGIRVK